MFVKISFLYVFLYLNIEICPDLFSKFQPNHTNSLEVMGTLKLYISLEGRTAAAEILLILKLNRFRYSKFGY